MTRTTPADERASTPTSSSRATPGHAHAVSASASASTASCRRALATLTAFVVTVLAALSGTVVVTSPAVHAAAPYSVAATVSRGYSGGNVGINNYTVRNLGAYAAVGSAGEQLPVWCIQAHLGHSTAAGGYQRAASNLVESGAMDYLLWKYRSFDLLDGAGEANDRAAAINGLTLFYARSPRNGNSLRVWSNSISGAAISPESSSGHRWSSLPQFSLSFPIGMYDLGRRNYDRAEQLTDELFHEAEQFAAPWSLTAVADDTVRLTAASGAPVGGHAVVLTNSAGEVIANAATDAAGEVTVTDPRVTSVRADAPGVHVELSAGAGAQRLVGGGTPAELIAEVSMAWEPTVATQVSAQSAMPFATVTDSLRISGVPDGAFIDVELELYDLDQDPIASGPPLTSTMVGGLGNGWSHGHAPYTVRADHQGARLSYRERWINPTTGEHGPWSDLGIVEETVTIGHFAVTSQVQTPLVPVGAAVVDRVGYPAGLDPDAGRWELGSVVATLDGGETAATATAEFHPDGSGGHVDVEIALGGLVAGRYVVFQDLLLDGALVASHRDADDVAQQFVVTPPEPLSPESTLPEPTEPTPTEVPTGGGGGGGSGGGELPTTGTSTASILVIAAIIVAAGATMWFVVQQERRFRGAGGPHANP